MSTIIEMDAEEQADREADQVSIHLTSHPKSFWFKKKNWNLNAGLQ